MHLVTMRSDSEAEARPNDVLQRVTVVLWERALRIVTSYSSRKGAYLVERPCEASSHAVLLRERCLVTQGVCVVVRHDRLARRVVQERRVTAIVPRCVQSCVSIHAHIGRA